MVEICLLLVVATMATIALTVNDLFITPILPITQVSSRLVLYLFPSFCVFMQHWTQTLWHIGRRGDSKDEYGH